MSIERTVIVDWSILWVVGYVRVFVIFIDSSCT